MTDKHDGSGGDSLGWLGGSTLSIGGRSAWKPIRVTNTSVIGLRAELFKQEQMLKRAQSDPELRKAAAADKISKLKAFKQAMLTNSERPDDVLRRDQAFESYETEKLNKQRHMASEKFGLYSKFSSGGYDGDKSSL
jgi:hypothetical protein